MYQSFIMLLAVAALFAFLNTKFIKLPQTIGLMILGMGLSALLFLLKIIDFNLFLKLPQILGNLDFHDYLMNVILSFLLFAGSVHIDVKALDKERIPVFLFAIFGTIISTLLVGYMTYFVFGWIGIGIPLLYCMLFGALISPTDPIAVLSIFKNYNVNKSLTLRIEGESLFNDGIGIVIFVTILHLISGGEHDFSLGETAVLFLREAIGGILFGLLLGLISLYFLKQLVKEPKTGVLITLVVATGGYAVANAIDVSGALAMVAAGLTIGNWVNKYAGIENKTLIKTFWEILDEVFNSTLFVLMGLAIMLVDPNAVDFEAAILTIIIVLIARFVSVTIPFFLIKQKNHKFPWVNFKVVTIMTWSGLRGALAFALALSLGNSYNAHFIIFLTYTVAAFSIIVQGLTIGKLVKRLKIK